MNFNPRLFEGRFFWNNSQIYLQPSLLPPFTIVKKYIYSEYAESEKMLTSSVLSWRP